MWPRNAPACRCDFGKAKAELYEELAANFARSIAKSIGDSSISPGVVRTELLHMASISLGVRSI